MIAALVNESGSRRNYFNTSSGGAGTISSESIEFKSTKMFFYFLILLCTTIGNAMVVYVICTCKTMRTSSNVLILNLAICDMLTPLISIPFDFALEENGYTWMYGRFMCKILGPSATVSTTASSLTLAAISLDRYRIIMHPFKTRLSSRQIKVIICGIYAFSVMAVSPYVYVLQVKDDLCQEDWPQVLHRQLYTMALFLIQYTLPLIFMIVMYTFAVKNLYSASSKVRGNSITTCSVGNTTENVQTMDGPVTPKRKSFSGGQLGNVWKKQKENLRAEENPNTRATKMFMTVVAVFAVFMFPNQVLWLWADYGNGADQPHFLQTAIICWLFTYTNGVVNPIIFGVFSKDFRTGFKELLKIVFCCKRDGLSSYMGLFELFSRTRNDGEKQEEQDHIVSAGYCVSEYQRHLKCPTSKKTESQLFPSRSFEDVQESTHSYETNDFLDANMEGEEDETTCFIVSYAAHFDRSNNVTTECNKQQSISLTERSIKGSNTLTSNGDLIDYLAMIKTNVGDPFGLLDENVMTMFAELPETDC